MYAIVLAVKAVRAGAKPPVLRESAAPSPDGCAAMAGSAARAIPPERNRSSTMSNHHLFVHRTDGTVEPATSQEVLAAARSVLAHRVRRGAVLGSPEKVGEYLAMRLGHLDYECFGLVLVDARHRVIDCVVLFRGTIDGAAIYPREVIKLVLEKGAAAAVAFHNHPSMIKDQSHADELITRRLKESLDAIEVRLLDHLIVTASEVLSFAQKGLL